MALPQVVTGRSLRWYACGAGLAGCLLAAIPALAGGAPAVVSPPHAGPAAAPGEVDATLAPECRVPAGKLYALGELGGVRSALAQNKPLRILSVGSSAAGLGVTTSYPVRLQNALERAFPKATFDIETRGLPGEIAGDAAERLRAMVADVEPTLVVWQVGTNDALARVEGEAFAETLDETVRWVRSYGIDIVLVDPVYTPSLAEDAHYTDLVRQVEAVAARERVPLVRRHEATRFLSTQIGERGEDEDLFGRHFRLNDLGQRCLAEHVARVVTLSVTAAPPDADGKSGDAKSGDAKARSPEGTASTLPSPPATRQP